MDANKELPGIITRIDQIAMDLEYNAQTFEGPYVRNRAALLRDEVKNLQVLLEEIKQSK